MVLKDSAKSRLRPRIALLMDAIADDYQAGVVRGAASAAQQARVELICLAGGVVGSPSKDPRAHRNFLFDLLDPRDFDGILALGGTLSSQLGSTAFSDWMKRFSPLPMVSLGVELESCHSLVVDGVPGMKDTLRHLIHVHNHRRIAFIRGPLNSVPGGIDRRQAGAEARSSADDHHRQALLWLRQGRGADSSPQPGPPRPFACSRARSASSRAAFTSKCVSRSR